MEETDEIKNNSEMSTTHTREATAPPLVVSSNQAKASGATPVRRIGQKLQELSSTGARKLLIAQRKIQEWMGRPPEIRDDDLDTRLRSASIVQQDLAVLAASAARLASAFRTCGVMHLQLASAAQDMGRHAPSLEATITVHKTVAQAHSKQFLALAAVLDEFESRVNKVTQSGASAIQVLCRLQQQFSEQRRLLEVDCAAFERGLLSGREGVAKTANASSPRLCITREAVEAALAADQGCFPSPHAARMAQLESRVLQGFNALDRLRAEMVQRTELLTPEQVLVLQQELAALTAALVSGAAGVSSVKTEAMGTKGKHAGSARHGACTVTGAAPHTSTASAGLNWAASGGYEAEAQTADPSSLDGGAADMPGVALCATREDAGEINPLDPAAGQAPLDPAAARQAPRDLAAADQMPLSGDNAEDVGVAQDPASRGEDELASYQDAASYEELGLT